MLVWVLKVARWAKCLVRYSKVLWTVDKYFLSQLLHYYENLVNMTKGCITVLTVKSEKGSSSPEVRGWQLFDDLLNV